MKQISEANAEAAGRHIKGATIAWGPGDYLDLADPDNIRVALDDYAYALAYTVRWRGQCRIRVPEKHPNGHSCRSVTRRPFYGVGQHVVIGAEELLEAGYSVADAVAFLFHESDEVPFGDVPGPAKRIPEVRAFCDFAGRIGSSIDRGFNITVPDPDLIKRWDIRMLATEKRDLLSVAFADDVWHEGASGGRSLVGFEPFARKIVPYSHPEYAAVRFLELCRALGVQTDD